MDTTHNIYGHWLANVSGIGRRTIFLLLQKYGDEERIYFHHKDWKENDILTQEQLYNLKKSREESTPQLLYEKLSEKGIRFITYGENDYPASLLNIPDPPYGIYVRGKLPSASKPCVAIIGARQCSEYGRKAAQHFASFLAKEDIQIISGMARGIDGIGQDAALLAGGYSLGVLGCGIDVCYPKENQQLYNRLIKNGGILSEHPPGTQPLAFYFPERNRMISGLADAVLIVEAREKSGTMITADMALEQGRDVYAIPGRLTDALSRGCNRLICQGARLASSPEEILYDLLGRVKRGVDITESNPFQLEGEEYLIYNILDSTPRSCDELYQSLSENRKNIDTAEFMSLLFKLVLKGAASQQGTGCYRKNL